MAESISSGASEELLRFSKMINAPVTTSLMGKGSFPEDNPLSLGRLGMHGRKTSNLIVNDCDCLY